MEKLHLEIKYNRGSIVKGYLLDLSYGGMSIACPKLINKGAMVDILNKSSRISPMRGKVVSVVSRDSIAYGYRLGVKFISAIKKENKLRKLIGGAEKRKKARLNLS